MLRITETERVYVRAFNDSDVQRLSAVFSDPEVMRFSSHGVRDRKAIADFIHRSQALYAADGFGQWGVFTQQSHEFIGVVGLNKSQVSGRELVHVSYRFKQASQGQGYATETVQQVLQYAHTVLGFSTMYALIDAKNAPSEKLAKKVGFVKQSTCILKGEVLGLFHCHLV